MSRSQTVEIEVDLSDFDTEDLIEEIRARRARREKSGVGSLSQGLAAVPADFVNDLRQAFLSRDHQHFEVLLMRMERIYDSPRTTIDSTIAALPGLVKAKVPA